MALGYGRTSTQNFSCAKFIVDTNGIQAGATHSTIASAIASASSGDTIFIKPGTYTEDFSLLAGINLSAFTCDATTPNVSIVGKLTFTGAGTVSLSGLRLTTNSDFFLAVTGSAASIVYLDNCYLNSLNNFGISHTSTNASSLIRTKCCFGDIGTTLISLFTSTSAGNIQLNYTRISNSGSSVTPSTISTGNYHASFCDLSFPVASTSVATIGGSYTDYNGIGNTTCLTIDGTGESNQTHCKFEGGSASAVSFGTGASGSLSFCHVGSTNTNAITGLGTIHHGAITFTGTSNLINTTTQTGFYTNLGKYKADKQPAFSVYVTAELSNVTGDSTVYTVVFGSERFDQDNNFDGTSTFTAPVTGKYRLSVLIALLQLTTSFTSYNLKIVTSNRNYVLTNMNPGAVFGANTQFNYGGTFLADMDANDTATVTLNVDGSTKTIDLQQTNTIFCGNLVC